MKIRSNFKKLKASDKVPELTLHFKQSLLDKKSLDTAEDRANFVRQAFNPGTFELQEELILVLLDSLDRPTAYYQLAKGGVDEVFVDQGLLFMILACTGTKAFFLSHNHPHKLPLASYTDIESAHDIRMKTKKMGIEMVDDIVIGSLEEDGEEKGYYSLEEKGLLFE